MWLVVDVCRRLYEDPRDLFRLGPDSELSFAATWIRRFHAAGEQNYVERFIYLWVTFNAWAAQVVP